VSDSKSPVRVIPSDDAASSAFSPVFSPARLHVKDGDFEPGTGVDLQKPPYTEDITDGGVYDNLGLETAWKNYGSILVSDGGGKMASPVAQTGELAAYPGWHRYRTSRSNA
jgi:NTE family protein